MGIFKYPVLEKPVHRIETGTGTENVRCASPYSRVWDYLEMKQFCYGYFYSLKGVLIRRTSYVYLMFSQVGFLFSGLNILHLQL